MKKPRLILKFKLLELVFFTPSGATGNARFRALEIVSTNLVWLFDKEEEIIKAFGDIRFTNNKGLKKLESVQVPKKSSSDFLTTWRSLIRKSN